MQIRDLIPWNREKGAFGPRNENGDSPLASLQRDINRVFEDFWGRVERPFNESKGGLGNYGPNTDISETDKGVEVSLELPGMDENDIDVSVSDGVLTVRGEKKAEKETEKKGYYLAERSYGAFFRSIPLPPGVDPDKADADFKKGVLTITFPKTEEAQSKVKKIKLKSV